MRREATTVIALGFAALGIGYAAGLTAATSAGTPIAIQAVKPMSPQDLENRMKDIGTAFPAMRTHLMEGTLPDAVDDAEKLATLFADVERFWAQNKRTDAVQWAQNARTLAIETAAAATAGDAAKARRTAESMLGACRQCHMTYRDTDEAGAFRIKPGVLPQS